MKRQRKIVMVLLALGLMGLLALGLRPAPVPVNVVETRLAPFTEWVSEEGRTRLRETYTVSAPIAGYLQRVRPEPGDAVALGEALFLMEPLPAPALDARSLEQARENLSAARARQQTARANLETIDADARFAAAEYQRYRELHERGLVSTTEMERARNQRDRQQAARRAAEHAVEVAGFELESARAVLEIASGQRPEGDQPELALRSPIEGLVLRRHRCCEGAIAAVEAVLDGFRVEAEFEIWQTGQAVQLPASALFRHGDGWAVYTVEQGRARLHLDSISPWPPQA